MIKEYNATQLNEVHWDMYKNGREVKAYTFEMMNQSTTTYVANAHGTLSLLAIDDFLIPLTKPSKKKRNSYVLSPFTQYVTYAKEELWELNNPFLEIPLKGVLTVLGYYLKIGRMDDVIIVNNWLLSTNLYEEMRGDQIIRIIDYLKQQYKKCAIMFRSLTYDLNEPLIKALKENHSLLVPSRSVFLFFPHAYNDFKKSEKKRIKQDYRLLRKSGYQFMTHDKIKEADIEKVLPLYNALYLDKYSTLNPQFTNAFIKQAWRKNLLTFILLKKNGIVDGVVGFVTRNNVMTTPILGYDVTKPKKLGLYRLCSILLTDHSLNKGLTLHRSGGAGEFKRLRGAKNTIEYSGVYTKHLSTRKRIIWRSLAIILNKLAVPLLQRKGL